MKQPWFLIREEGAEIKVVAKFETKEEATLALKRAARRDDWMHLYVAEVSRSASRIDPQEDSDFSKRIEDLRQRMIDHLYK